MGGAEPIEGFSNYAMAGKELPCLGIAGDRGVAHVHHCVLDIGVPQPVLHKGDIHAGVQEMHCNRVATLIDTLLIIPRWPRSPSANKRAKFQVERLKVPKLVKARAFYALILA